MDGQSMSALPEYIRRDCFRYRHRSGSQLQPLRCSFPAASVLWRVEKQNSDDGVILKLVEYLYFSTRKCGFA